MHLKSFYPKLPTSNTYKPTLGATFKKINFQIRKIITARKRSCGKVMFLRVYPSSGRGGGSSFQQYPHRIVPTLGTILPGP